MKYNFLKDRIYILLFIAEVCAGYIFGYSIAHLSWGMVFISFVLCVSLVILMIIYLRFVGEFYKIIFKLEEKE